MSNTDYTYQLGLTEEADSPVNITRNARIPNRIILQKDEILNFRLVDYMSGSFIAHRIDIWDISDGTHISIPAGRIFGVNGPYNRLRTNWLPKTETAAPMPANSLTLYINEPYFREQVFVMYVDEEYKLVINSTDFFVKDLRPVITNFIGYYR